MSDIRDKVSALIAEYRDRLPDAAHELADRVSEALGGPHAKVREQWNETRTDNDCPSGAAGRTCYRVNHGDGSYSETWCDGWSCL